MAFTSHRYPQQSPPGNGDIQSPCPLLNSLANYNIIPHNGKNLTIPILVKVLNKTVYLSSEIATGAAIGRLSLAPDPSTGHFQLDDLNKHNGIKYNASPSRVDFHFVGKDGVAKFNYTTFKRWFSHFQGQEFIDIETAAEARFTIVKHSVRHNPEFTYIDKKHLSSYIKTSLYFKAMVDKWGRTKKKFIRILFGKNIKSQYQVSILIKTQRRRDYPLRKAGGGPPSNSIGLYNQTPYYNQPWRPRKRRTQKQKACRLKQAIVIHHVVYCLHSISSILSIK